MTKCSVFAVQAMSKNKFPWNIGALGIKFFQKTNYSHYALLLCFPDGRKKYFDSTPWGVRENTQYMFTQHYSTKSEVLIDEIGYYEFEKFFDLHRGKYYGFGQIIGIALKLFHLVSKNPFGKGAKYVICNELVLLYTNYRRLTNIIDTDSLDLNDTEEIIENIKFQW